jgi:signal transduction histidine kinase
MMYRPSPSNKSASLDLPIKLAEIGVIFFTAIGEWIWLFETHNNDELYRDSLALLVVAAVYVFVMPLRKDKLASQVALFVQVALYAALVSIGAYRLYGLIHLFLAGKASTILSKKLLFFFVPTLFLSHLSGQLLSIDHFHTLSAHILQVEPHRYVGLAFFEGQIFFLASVVVVTLFGRTFLKEQDSRRRAEELSQEVEELALVSERNRISRDIHDNLGHSLTSLSIQLELTAKLLEQAQQEEAKQSLALSRDLASRSLTDVRKAIHSIAEGQISISSATNELTQRIAKQQKVTFDVEIDESKIPTSLRHNLFFIIKECLTNIQKHANASKVEIALGNCENSASLKIHDNGGGFLVSAPVEGFGLKGMKERIKSLGGTFKIESHPGKGTLIEIEVPN